MAGAMFAWPGAPRGPPPCAPSSRPGAVARRRAGFARCGAARLGDGHQPLPHGQSSASIAPFEGDGPERRDRLDPRPLGAQGGVERERPAPTPTIVCRPSRGRRSWPGPAVAGPRRRSTRHRLRNASRRDGSLSASAMRLSTGPRPARPASVTPGRPGWPSCAPQTRAWRPAGQGQQRPDDPRRDEVRREALRSGSDRQGDETDAERSPQMTVSQAIGVRGALRHRRGGPDLACEDDQRGDDRAHRGHRERDQQGVREPRGVRDLDGRRRARVAALAHRLAPRRRRGHHQVRGADGQEHRDGDQHQQSVPGPSRSVPTGKRHEHQGRRRHEGDRGDARRGGDPAPQKASGWRPRRWRPPPS